MYHLTATAQQWYYILERDAGEPIWEDFRRLSHRRFGPPLHTNHLANLARLPFTTSMEAYQEAFQARMAHAGCLSLYQQAQLFAGGLPEYIRVDMEMHDPKTSSA